MYPSMMSLTTPKQALLSKAIACRLPATRFLATNPLAKRCKSTTALRLRVTLGRLGEGMVSSTPRTRRSHSKRETTDGWTTKNTRGEADPRISQDWPSSRQFAELLPPPQGVRVAGCIPFSSYHNRKPCRKWCAMLLLIARYQGGGNSKISRSLDRVRSFKQSRPIPYAPCLKVSANGRSRFR